MKVKELVKILGELNPDYDVILSKDGEGNEFSPLDDYSLQQYIPDSTWSGEILSKEDCEDEGTKYRENCVVLWPTN